MEPGKSNNLAMKCKDLTLKHKDLVDILICFDANRTSVFQGGQTCITQCLNDEYYIPRKSLECTIFAHGTNLVVEAL